MASGQKAGREPKSLWQRFHEAPFTSVDRWFALLRVTVILGGLGWLFLAPLDPQQKKLIFYDFLFFCAYTIVLYIFIFQYPQSLRSIYLIALLLDLAFLYFLIRYTGGLHSDFFIAFFLLIALHSFYFGLRIGLTVMLLSTFVYLAAGYQDWHRFSLVELGLKITFFLLVAVSMGLLSLKEKRDRERIQRLNEELDRRKAELEREKEKLENIIVGIGAGLVMVDRQLRIVWANPIAEGWFGPKESLLGRTCGQALWGEDTPCDACPTILSFQKGTVEKGEYSRITPEGDRRFFRITTAPIRSEQGEVEYVLELIQDITEEKTLHAQVVQASKLAAIGELASGVAHEINNPLSAIAVCVEELLELAKNTSDDPDSTQKELLDCVQSIKNDIQRCKRITTGLLNFSRKQEPTFEPIDVNQILMNLGLLVRHRAELSQKTVDFQLSRGLPLIMGSADELAQVFLNIIINALDFTPSGKSITVRSERLNEREICVQIADEGCGIPEENLSKVFSPFFTTKPPGEGTGLGLAISKRIIDRHGGKIKILSKEGEGTTVRVILPVEPEKASSDRGN
jgi:PAS domain S-box-containing protein